MIKQITIFLFLLTTTYTFSQESHDVRLLERYSTQELNDLKKNNLEEYTILDHALDVGISIGDIQTGKDLKFDGELDADPTQSHTYISLGLELINRYQYFKFKGTNQMVVVRPKNTISLIK